MINAVEEGANCREVVQQISAVSKAIDRAGFLVISSAMKECLMDPDGSGEYNPEQLEKMFLSLS